MSHRCDVLFIHPPHHRRKESGTILPLGLAYLAACARDNNFYPQVIDCAAQYSSVNRIYLENMKEWLECKILEMKPRLAVAIGPCMTSNIKGTIAIADTCHKCLPSTPMIFGGPLASTPNQEWLFFNVLHASAVIPGEGELVLVNLLKAIRDKKVINDVDGVITESNPKIQPAIIQDLNALPFPARDLFPNSLYKLSLRRELFSNPFANLVTTRGCPYSCPFCLSGTLNNRHRRRSLDNIMREIKSLIEQQEVKSLVFYDDLMFPNKSTLNEDIGFFCEAVDRTTNGSILWQIEIRPDLLCELEDATMIKMVNAGCRQLNLGIEKGYEKGIRYFGKKINLDELKDFCNSIKKKYKTMRLAGTFIIGGSNETEDEALQTIDYSRELNLLYAHFNPLKLYPGTKYYNDKYGEESKH
jgi:radical SAM superfamily enzyme YgiQ (UPF0313 family)